MFGSVRKQKFTQSVSRQPAESHYLGTIGEKKKEKILG